MAVDTNIRLADGDHVVQFYDGEEDLMGTVVGYLGGAVLAGDAVIVIATAEHRDSIAAALTGAGVDVVGAHNEGRLMLVDAADTLARFMVDGGPDPAAFDAVVGTLVRDAAGTGRRVRAYGEMVGLLWDADDVTSAIELETLWNGLGEQTPFSLFCAYPVHMAVNAQTGEGFASICGLHSQVVAGAPAPEGLDVTRRFAPTMLASRQARRFVTETLHEWGLAGLVDEAALVVAELATNAVRHGESDVTVGLSRTSDGVRIEVGDSSTAVPVRRRQGSSRLSGRGLMLVDNIARAWGHRVVPGGKLVWVDLAGGI